MKTGSIHRWVLAVACLGLILSSRESQAQHHGQPCPSQQCPGCPICPTCPSCPGHCRLCQHDCCLEPIWKWAFCSDYYILPPDYGWNTPTKVPVVRQGVTYYRYWPEQWAGTGREKAGRTRTYPVVYSPTDTTQLGYTYQQVPYWQPAPYRLPPTPVPSQWHVREPHRGYYGSWQSYYTPIHHHQPMPLTSRFYWIEPIGPAAMPSGEMRPMTHPPAPEGNPPPKLLEPVPDAPGSKEPTPPPPPPPSAGRATVKSQAQLLSSFPRR
jgi:hypothetical protein